MDDDMMQHAPIIPLSISSLPAAPFRRGNRHGAYGCGSASLACGVSAVSLSHISGGLQYVEFSCIFLSYVASTAFLAIHATRVSVVQKQRVRILLSPSKAEFVSQTQRANPLVVELFFHFSTNCVQVLVALQASSRNRFPRSHSRTTTSICKAHGRRSHHSSSHRPWWFHASRVGPAGIPSVLGLPVVRSSSAVAKTSTSTAHRTNLTVGIHGVVRPVWWHWHRDGILAEGSRETRRWWQSARRHPHWEAEWYVGEAEPAGCTTLHAVALEGTVAVGIHARWDDMGRVEDVLIDHVELSRLLVMGRITDMLDLHLCENSCTSHRASSQRVCARTSLHGRASCSRVLCSGTWPHLPA